jgi:uncharacterized membrane protein YfcA
MQRYRIFDVVYIPILFGIALAGAFLGRSIAKRINQEFFRKSVLIAIILVSIKFIIDGVLVQ